MRESKPTRPIDNKMYLCNKQNTIVKARVSYKHGAQAFPTTATLSTRQRQSSSASVIGRLQFLIRCGSSILVWLVTYYAI